MFGVKAYAGRLLTPSEDRPNSTPVTVMSHRLWQQYGSNPSIMGSVFNLNGKPFTVVGIAPPGFFGDTLAIPHPISFCP
jgi:macrolide transport system ATP-binding/permease protein